MAKRPAIIVIDSATYLLMISSPDIDKVAMSLYDSETNVGTGMVLYGAEMWVCGRQLE